MRPVLVEHQVMVMLDQLQLALLLVPEEEMVVQAEHLAVLAQVMVVKVDEVLT
jgi:hypothetical protein